MGLNLPNIKRPPEPVPYMDFAIAKSLGLDCSQIMFLLDMDPSRYEHLSKMYLKRYGNLEGKILKYYASTKFD